MMRYNPQRRLRVRQGRRWQGGRRSLRRRMWRERTLWWPPVTVILTGLLLLVSPPWGRRTTGNLAAPAGGRVSAWRGPLAARCAQPEESGVTLQGACADLRPEDIRPGPDAPGPGWQGLPDTGLTPVNLTDNKDRKHAGRPGEQ